MKPFLTFFLTTLLSLTLSGVQMQPKERGILYPLKRDSIRIGHGPREAFVFIDPKCHRSAEFLEAVLDSEKLQSTFRYYLLVYDMPQVDSHRIVNAVYSAPDPLAALKTYMLERQKIGLEDGAVPPEVRRRIERVREAAEAIGLDHTPYLIMSSKPGSDQ